MKHILILVALSCIAGLPAIVANHIPPLGYEANRQQEIRVEVLQGWTDLLEAVMYFREQDSGLYGQVPMEKETPEGPWLKAVLPASTSPGQGSEYYFKFSLVNGSVETLPVSEAETHPFQLNPKSGAGEESADFILLSDDPSIPAKDGYILAVSWYALDDDLDNSTIQVYVNGKNVTKRVTFSDNVLVYKETDPRPGKANAYVTARTKSGRSLYSATWTTVIKASGNITVLPMNLRGSANAGTNVYASSKDPDASVFGSDKDNAWASLEMYSEYKKLALNAYTYLSTLESDAAQAVNRYRFGFALPVWETYLGDYSPDFSKLTMSNKNLRGIYTSLNTGVLGLTLAHGEMLRAVKGTEYTDAGKTKYTPGTFKQEALAMRLRLGREKGFSLSFNTTRNRDIISSLDRKYIQDGEAQLAFPQDDLVIGSDARLNLPAQNMVLGMEGAFSIYNKNTLPGPVSQDALSTYLGEDADFDPSQFEDAFIINTNMQPLPLSGVLKDPFPFSAWTAYCRSLWFNNLINLSYSRVGPYYKALSAGYLQNDAAMLSLSDQFNYKQYFFITAGLTNTRDNLARHQLESNLYTSFFGQALINIPGFPYFSLAYTGNQGENERNASIDSLGVNMYNPYKRSSDQLSLGLGYAFKQLPVAPTILDLGFRTEHYYEERQEALAATRMAPTYDDNNSNVTISLISKFNSLPLKTQISFSYNRQELLVSNQDKSNLNLMLRGEYRLFKDLLQPWAEFRTTSLSGDQDSQSYDFLTLGLQATPLPDTNIATSLGWKLYSNADQDEVNYNSVTWRLTLSQRF